MVIYSSSLFFYIELSLFSNFQIIPPKGRINLSSFMSPYTFPSLSVTISPLSFFHSLPSPLLFSLYSPLFSSLLLSSPLFLLFSIFFLSLFVLFSFSFRPLFVLFSSSFRPLFVLFSFSSLLFSSHLFSSLFYSPLLTSALLSSSALLFSLLLYFTLFCSTFLFYSPQLSSALLCSLFLSPSHYASPGDGCLQIFFLSSDAVHFGQLDERTRK